MPGIWLMVMNMSFRDNSSCLVFTRPSDQPTIRRRPGPDWSWQKYNECLVWHGLFSFAFWLLKTRLYLCFVLMYWINEHVLPFISDLLKSKYSFTWKRIDFDNSRCYIQSLCFVCYEWGLSSTCNKLSFGQRRVKRGLAVECSGRLV